MTGEILKQMSYLILVKEAYLEDKLQTGPVDGTRIEASNRRSPRRDMPLSLRQQLTN